MKEENIYNYCHIDLIYNACLKYFYFRYIGRMWFEIYACMCEFSNI